MCISTESWALWELVLPSCDQGHISVPREAWMTQLHVTLWPTEGAVSPLKLKKKKSLKVATFTGKVTMPTTASVPNRDERKQGPG